MEISARAILGLSLSALIAISCKAPVASAEDAGPTKTFPLGPMTFVDTAEVIVAIGDLHGDLAVAQELLRRSGLIDEAGTWSGGSAVAVQIGDLLDRGDDEPELLELVNRLAAESHAAGGAFYTLLGNHEVMNVDWDFRYVTDEGWTDFVGLDGLDLEDPELSSLPAEQRPRAAAFKPGGPYALRLAQFSAVMKIGPILFAHGGIEPAMAGADLELLNDEVREWISGTRSIIPNSVDSSAGLVWSRLFSSDTDEADCLLLEQSLSLLGAETMVVGHSPNVTGINAACDDRVWRVDVGLADYYGGPTQALRIDSSGYHIVQ